MTVPCKAYGALLSRHLRPQKGRFLLLVLLMLAGIGLRLANPQILRQFIDSALAGEALRRLALSALAFLAVALVQQAVSVGVAYLGQDVAWTAANALREELAWHALNLDMSFHNDHAPGVLIERIDGDVGEMAGFFSQFVVTLLGNGVLLAGILAALFREDWRVGLAFTAFTAAALLVLNRVKGIARADHKARRQAEADLFGFIEERLAGTEDIRSSGAVDHSLRELTRQQAGIWRANRRASFKRWIVEVVVGAFLVSGNLLAVLSGWYLHTGGWITVGTVYLLIHYFNLLSNPIQALTRQVDGFQTIGACVERLAEFRAVRPRVMDGAGAGPSGGSPALAFEDVSFSYDGKDRVLEGLTFSLEPGTVLGLLGRTGSGKTTLARLVFRLYDPTGGRISLDASDLRGMKLSALRRRVAVVTQDVQLFHASVRDNITFFDRAVPDGRILSVLSDLDLTTWIDSMPKGLDTELGTGGHSLSAGEAQLLAFVRVFLRDPGLVILDEASSRLDPATERRLEHVIDRLLAGRTAIVIAHRLGTVQRADKVMILDGGRIGEFGDRRTLAADPASRFHRLLQTGLEEVLA